MRTAPRCPVALTVEMIGGKWKSVILYFLLRDGTLRFGEIRTRVPGVTQRMLTLQLRELEADGLIARTVHAVVPPRVDYSLTTFGRSLGPVIDVMFEWGSRHRGRCERVIGDRSAA